MSVLSREALPRHSSRSNVVVVRVGGEALAVCEKYHVGIQGAELVRVENDRAVIQRLIAKDLVGSSAALLTEVLLSNERSLSVGG